ncbi:ATPase family AAA domain-containing protein 5 isoform X2 [Myripristis murdjan]|uniref:ATPase family AAA domain-containing protein 5 isoform X2 n=1 Tax=Myripristis murdjan TaxID=586833 RepID=UPI00117616B7|nr:ATPase family AAA domain-containing protein 5-like isoform X2 [Myripristis murdjan]
MAGVVAMASVIEDFETQPCKKSRKDGGSPVVKTITNYFPPVPKAIEKPFSPPRSNNIMDYFSRKTLPSREKTSTPEQSKENCQKTQSAEKHGAREAALKQPSQKRARRASKAARRLQELETSGSTAEGKCPGVKEPDGSGDSTGQPVSSCGILGSDTAALLAQLSADACIADEVSEKTDTVTVCVEHAQKDEHHAEGSSCGGDVKLKPELNSNALSPGAPLKDKVRRAKPAVRNSKKMQPLEAKPSEAERNDVEKSFSDVSMEVNVDESSQINTSTITISFEDFLQSQNQEKMEENKDKGEESKSSTEGEKMETDQLGLLKAEEKVDSGEPSIQVSPRTVTIQAEVHAVSPKQEAVKTSGKMASIFTMRKGTVSPKEVTLSQVTHQLPSSSVTVKRKSNVVLQEEDLELDVVESESTPKCNQAERKQFMAAFKQPSVDGSKSKPGKIQGKLKKNAEKTSEPGDKAAGEDAIAVPSVEQLDAPPPENKGTKKKPARKGRKKVQEEKEAVVASSPAASQEEPAAVSIEADAKAGEPTSAPAVRRSKREVALRQAPESVTATPVRKTRNQEKSTDFALPQDSPLQMSTPKTHKSRYGVFMAEIVSPADKRGSPIRMKLKRVNKSLSVSVDGSSCETHSPFAIKASNASKKRNQAKRLVEKAKVIQQGKRTAVTEVQSTLRRSSRAQASTKKSYCEDEDSVICLEDIQSATSQTVPEESKSKKPMRSLNDVLGKTTPANKEAKTPLEKTSRRASTVVSIFDDSSREGSENSQDDEQFRARREFLRSGLPESFRKQIAKTAATKEAYSLSGSSFQPVVHMQQPPQDCPLWSLPWPESSFLNHLKELWCLTSNPPPSLSGSFCFRTEPASRAFSDRGSGWRQEFSECVRRLLVEEVSASNPPFPVQKFISRFLKRRTEHLQQSTASEPEAVTKVTGALLSADPAGGKRKRIDEEESTVKVAKKQRSNRSGGNASTPEPESTKRGGRVSRATRRKQEEEEEQEKAKSLVQTAPAPSHDDSVIVLDDSPVTVNAEKSDFGREDVLWTDKYQPQHSSDIIGNTASVRKLHSWLKEWKLRTDREERKKQKEKKQGEGSNDSDWDCGEEDSQDGDDMLCNTLLITGPTGVGKTAAVYACAQELGFKVFEVNASSLRSGRLILSQLKEATQSHQVDIQGVNAHKPTYFNSYGSSSAGAVRPGSSPRKINSPRRVVSSPRKHPQSPRGAKRGCLAPTSLANFFKMGRPTNKEHSNADKTQPTAAPKKTVKPKEAAAKISQTSTTMPKEASSEEQSKKTATSLILFEEVDVIFDDDSGFLAAIKTFMTTTKRPVILTTSDPAFSTMFDGNFEEIHFKTPSVLDLGSYLRLLCLAEDMRTDPRDVSTLLGLNGCDIRQSLLQLQFWTRGGGGRRQTRPITNSDSNAGLKPETPGEPVDLSVCEVTVTPTLPPVDTSCTESMLGLLNIQPERDILELLRQGPLKEAVCWELLKDIRRRGVDLLHSNMETLLPLPLTQLTLSTHRPQQSLSVSQDQACTDPKELPSTGSQPDVLPSHAQLLHVAELAEGSDDGSPVKISKSMKKHKRQHRLPDQGHLHSDSDSEESFLSLRKPQNAAEATTEVKDCPVQDGKMAAALAHVKVKREPLNPEQRMKSLPVSCCLESLAGFLDNMSYLDSSLSFPPSPQGGDKHRKMFSFPLCAAVKDGMTDEPRVEFDRSSWAGGEQVLEIQATVEALSFHGCRDAVVEAWDKAQALEGELGKEAIAELTLPVAPHREGFSLMQDSPCQPKRVQQRREVMENLLFRGVFGTLGNRPAAAQDYLPALRIICKSEQLKEQGKIKRRFLHYLDAIHLGLDRSTLQHLAEDFP